MPKFITERVYKLDYLGEKWKDCFIKFESMSIKDNLELLERKNQSKDAIEIQHVTTEFFQRKLISGTVYDSVVALKKEDFELLPALIQEDMILFLVGGGEQKRK